MRPELVPGRPRGSGVYTWGPGGARGGEGLLGSFAGVFGGGFCRRGGTARRRGAAYDAGMSASRQIISTEHAPAAVGAYSQAVVVSGGRTLYSSGQIALDPASGAMVGEGDVEAQARQVMTNLAAVLEAGGFGFEQVVRATIYLADIADFAKVNTIYAGHFGAQPPARACVQAAGLPRGALVEIDVVAVGD